MVCFRIDEFSWINKWNNIPVDFSKETLLRVKIYTMYVHCQIIYNLFLQALETGRKASFSSLIHSECKLILYLTTVYVYCIYLAISKSTKHLSNCLRIAETSGVLIVFNGVICDRCFLSLYMNQVSEILY